MFSVISILTNTLTWFSFQELRQGFDNEAKITGKPPLLLTAAVAAGKSKIDNGYDVPTIAR